MPVLRKPLSTSLIALLLGVAATVWAGEGGTQTLSLDAAMTGGTVVSFGEGLHCTNPQLVLWWCSSGWKISLDHPAPQLEGSAIRLSAARNEAEAVQLVIRPKNEIRISQVSISELKGPEGAIISPGEVDILKVRYVPVNEPTDSSTTEGFWPDPLPPLQGPFTVRPGQNQPLWIRLHVPLGIPGGVYRGTLLVKGNQIDETVQIWAEVYDFDLPDEMTCTASMGFSEGTAFQYHAVTDPGHKLLLLAKYWETLSAHHINPYDPAPLDPFQVTWPRITKGSQTDPTSLKPTIDWTSWDKAIQEAVEYYHFTNFEVPIPGLGGGRVHSRQEPELLGFTEDTPQYQAAFRNYCQQVQEHLRQKGWLERSYIYWFDQPGPSDFTFVMNGFHKLKESAPDIPRVITKEVTPLLMGGPSIWCSRSFLFKMEDARPRQALGEKFWWYLCTTPKAPYCTLFIDHPATELRVWLWQTYQRKINGILVWRINSWNDSGVYPDPASPQNPYEDPMSWTTRKVRNEVKPIPYGNGDGRFLYPPESAAKGNPKKPVLDAPVDSIRLEMLRDGIEDYEYLVILRNRLASAKKVPATYRQLLEVPREITTSMTEFTKIPVPIEKQRDNIARAIEKLK